MRRIETDADVAAGIEALTLLDPRLAAVAAAAGPVPLRRVAPGFAALVSIVVAQQVSRASADAILGRFARLVDPLDPGGVLAAGEEVFRAAGLSRPKQRTLVALAAAVADGLDLDRIAAADAREAMAALTAVPGIGPWTAEVYLLSAAGHPDVFPAGDVALQGAVARGLALAGRPDAKRLTKIAESWAPWRAVAARLFWAYWRETAGRDAAPTLEIAKTPAKGA